MPHYMSSPSQKARKLEFSSCNPRGKKRCKYINVHVDDTLFLRLSVQRVQLRCQLYFGGSGPGCCPLASLTRSSPRGTEVEGAAWRCGVVEGVHVFGCQCALELSVVSCRAVSIFCSPPWRQQVSVFEPKWTELSKGGREE